MSTCFSKFGVFLLCAGILVCPLTMADQTSRPAGDTGGSVVSHQGPTDKNGCHRGPDGRIHCH